MSEYRPFYEVGIGTGLVLLVLLVHGFAMFAIQGAFDRWRPRIARDQHPVLGRVFMGGVVLSLIIVHYLEILLWASTMFQVGALPDMRSAFYSRAGPTPPTARAIFTCRRTGGFSAS